MSILIDGHIHIHPAVDLDGLLDSAWENFSRIRQEKSPSPVACSFVLLLAEGRKNDVFSRLMEKAQQAGSKDVQHWIVTSTAESNSVLAIQAEKKIILIAGRQLISREKLELLSLFCPKIFSDNRYPLKELAKLVTDAGGLPLLAWGVGKWMGKREKVIEDFLAHPPVPVFLVGDNGNRPIFWSYPKVLSRAEHQGVPSLAGSDPLPLAHHEQRAGSYGGRMEGVTLGDDHPAHELQMMLVSGNKIIPYGQRVGLFQFMSDQVRVNVQKRLGRGNR